MLSFESSAKAASVALTREDGSLVAISTQSSGLTHSRTLLPMAEDLLKNTEIGWDEIDAYAVAAGPGSFTGIRIGIATVKGLAWAREKGCVGVSTLAAMAWNGLTWHGPICCVMDARRSEVYNALFRSEGEKLFRLCPDRAISLDALCEELSAPDGDPPLLIGDGAELTANFLRERGLPFCLAPAPLRMQNAWGVAMEAKDLPLQSSADLLPVYLRLSQAERERQARLHN